MEGVGVGLALFVVRLSGLGDDIALTSRRCTFVSLLETSTLINGQTHDLHDGLSWFLPHVHWLL